MSHFLHLETFQPSHDHLMITITVLVIVASYTFTLKCCMQGKNKNKTITFNHNGIITKVISNATECSEILTTFMHTNPRVIGLDCEWVKHNKISLLQIANRSTILLIRLQQLSAIPSELIRLLSDIQIIKCGVGIKNDVKKLKSHYNLETVGCIELNNLYHFIHKNENIRTNISLKNMYKMLFDKSMQYKDINITRSNWEAQTLNNKQLHYAADDALVGYQIFNALIQSYLIETNNKKQDSIDYMQLLYGLIDNFERYKFKPITNTTKKYDKSDGLGRSNVLNNVGKKQKFDNCKLLQPNGDLLGFCSKFALKWHLNEGLAVKLDETTIKLKQTKPVKVQIFDEYIRTESPNLCFVCGSVHNLRKYSVFPVGYTQYINAQYYDRSCFNHDNILLCLLCNKKAQRTEIAFKKLLCDRHKNVAHFEIPTKLWYAIKCAKTLRRDERRKQIPICKQIKLYEQILTHRKVKYEVIYEEKVCVEELTVHGFLRMNGIVSKIGIFEQCLLFYYNKKDIPMRELITLSDTGMNEKETQNIDKVLGKHINELADFDQKKQLKLHCKELAKAFGHKQLEFIGVWRRNFMDSLKPRYLPKNW